ncbi:hypothetical protein [Ralstonia phage RSP15]|uniref:hypothetical protein n=1 Tax=Ralstonia phage RSP15 TaxID=1785960 RepID=UPI00074D4068|nr:hypothetical protein BH754_gp222 [Ralstonia phage RSP15]BAU40084.1 hypothetical protein [Ralstonia phage RSP15]
MRESLENDCGFDLEALEEALISFGGKRDSQFGNVIILAGGAGSGKGFVLSNLIGLQGKVLDVDALKVAASRSPLIQKKAREEYGVDMSQMNLRNPEDTERMHYLIGKYMNLPDRKEQALFTSIMAAAPDRKPNLIFDVTLSKMSALHDISMYAQDLGYDLDKIHIVWVINDITIALQQNARRSRVVPEDIFLSTHKGASMTMLDILKMGEGLQRYMDGFIYFAFNKAKVDAEIEMKARHNSESDVAFPKASDKASYIKKANYFIIKKPGKPPASPDELGDQILNKIRDYTPDLGNW